VREIISIQSSWERLHLRIIVLFWLFGERRTTTSLRVSERPMTLPLSTYPDEEQFHLILRHMLCLVDLAQARLPANEHIHTSPLRSIGWSRSSGEHEATVMLFVRLQCHCNPDGLFTLCSTPEYFLLLVSLILSFHHFIISTPLLQSLSQ
jgi:hypothetical protein